MAFLVELSFCRRQWPEGDSKCVRVSVCVRVCVIPVLQQDVSRACPNGIRGIGLPELELRQLNFYFSEQISLAIRCFLAIFTN